MVHFVGAGPGAPDLITLRGARLLQQADVIIYAGSLVNEVLENAKQGCEIYNSAHMTLEEVLDVMRKAIMQQRSCAFHTGDPCFWRHSGANGCLQMGIAYDDTPGVSSFCAAAAALGAEYTLPGVSQSVIITRMEGRTPVPERERLDVLAQHGTSMVLFLSAGMTQRVQDALLAGAYTADTPAAIVYKASWEDEKTVRCTVGTLAQAAQENGISKTALLLIGDFLGEGYNRSLLYHPSFETEFRKASK